MKEFVNVRHNGHRYEVELPFKGDCLPIPDNYNLCYNRLKSMHFKLSKTPDILLEYENIIQEQLAAGIIEKIPNQSSEELNNEDVHYLLHHGVIRKNRENMKLPWFMTALQTRQDSSFPSMTVYQLARITYRNWRMYL